mmetsp:Transcript_17437/g.22388  ORF Transcript_17437/g.22388 Transcript_17437/m.22388 type:complete len:201 (+) Transcript_17437:317-919(+)
MQGAYSRLRRLCDSTSFLREGDSLTARAMAAAPGVPIWQPSKHNSESTAPEAPASQASERTNAPLLPKAHPTKLRLLKELHPCIKRPSAGQAACEIWPFNSTIFSRALLPRTHFPLDRLAVPALKDWVVATRANASRSSSSVFLQMIVVAAPATSLHSLSPSSCRSQVKVPVCWVARSDRKYASDKASPECSLRAVRVNG